MRIVLLFLVLFYTQACVLQESPPREVFSDKFNWTITIPKDFEQVNAEEWSKQQKKGEEAVEDTYGEDITNLSKTLFVFRNNQFNYLEANYQPYEVDTLMTYAEECKEVSSIIYETFRVQMPDAVIDTLHSEEYIDNLMFHKFEMEIIFPNKMVMKVHMHTRLFGKEEFSLNIFYIDESQGQKMLKAWKTSTFKK